VGDETAIVRFSLVRRFRAGFQFLENANDLTFRETGLAHADSFRARSLRFHTCGNTVICGPTVVHRPTIMSPKLGAAGRRNLCRGSVFGAYCLSSLDERFWTER